MKKLYLTLLACLMSISAMAWPDVYLRGDMTDWGENDTYKFSSTDGVTYTLKLSSLEAGKEFKIHYNENYQEHWCAPTPTGTLANYVSLTDNNNNYRLASGNYTDLTLTYNRTEDKLNIDGIYSLWTGDLLFNYDSGNGWKTAKFDFDKTNNYYIAKDVEIGLSEFQFTLKAGSPTEFRAGITVNGTDPADNVFSQNNNNCTAKGLTVDTKYNVVIRLNDNGNGSIQFVNNTPAAKATVFLNNSLNKFNESNDWKFATVDGKTYTLGPKEIDGGFEFKVVIKGSEDQWLTPNLSGSLAQYLSVPSNIKFNDGSYQNVTFTYTLNGGLKVDGERLEPCYVSAKASQEYSLNDNNEFWENFLDITLTPSAGTASYTYKINDGSTIKVNGATPASITIGKTDDNYDNYGSVYTITWTATDKRGNTTTGTISYTKKLNIDDFTNSEGNNYYLYGDINRWSVAGYEERGDSKIIYHNESNGQGRKLSEVYTSGLDQNNIHRDELYADRATMIRDWRFEKCDKPNGASDNNTGDWYKFDLSRIKSLDGNHDDGRLCGQFKIIRGNLYSSGYAEWGGNQGAKGDGKYYNGNTVQLGTSYIAKTGSTQNLALPSNIINNAVIYFNPSNGEIFITSNAPADKQKQPIYLYYWNKTSNLKPTSVELLGETQYNYYINRSDFDNKNNAKNYEAVDVSTIPGMEGFAGATNTTAYRIALPASTEHRNPISYFARIKGQEVETSSVIGCEDIWLIEGRLEPSDISLQVDCQGYNGINAGPMCYNVKRVKLNDAGQPVGYETLYPDKNAYMIWNAETKRWTGSRPISGRWMSGSEITFYDGFGREVTFPLNGDAHFDYICGDLYDSNLKILYTHLKGTYDADRHKDLQIEAEVFLDDDCSKMDVSYTGITYDFKVYDEYGRDCSSQITHEPEYAPFAKWNVSEAGWYNVRVTATDVASGQSFTAIDRYPVFGKNHVSRPADFATPDAAANKVSSRANDGFTVYFSYDGSQPYIYYYGNDFGNPGWDASNFHQMDKVADGLWSYTMTSKPSGFIFLKDNEGNKVQEFKDSDVSENHIYSSNSHKSATVYVIGKNIDGVSDWNEKSGAPITVSGEVTFKDDAYFRFKDNISNWNGNYYPSTNDEQVSAGNTYTAQYTDGTTENRWKAPEAGTYTITFNAITNKFSLTKKSDITIDVPGLNPYMPDELPEISGQYLISGITEDDWGGTHTVNGQNNSWQMVHAARLTVNDNGAVVDDPNLDVNYSWAKFEDYENTDGTSYADNTPDGAPREDNTDNYEVANNHSTVHYCANWNLAFYRVYATSEVNIPANSDKKRVTHGSHGNVNFSHLYRVARTVPRDTKGITSVNQILGDNDTDAPVFFFDLQGRAVDADNLTPGLYIRRQGSQASKVLVR